MRVGFNPTKDRELEATPFFHQVVVPVYIPNADGYFKDGLAILQLCLRSLQKTCHRRTFITVVNNGSCPEVRDYITGQLEAGLVHEVVHTTSIGYINAMLKAITGHSFRFITTTGHDVLFLNGWQDGTYRIFEAFPKTGSVSPVPNSRVLRLMTGNLLCEMLASRAFRFGPVKNPEAMREFARSIGNPQFFNDLHLAKCLTLTCGGVEAVAGAPHFVVTHRSDVFDRIQTRATRYALGGGTDDVFDAPAILKGYWRLSTADNFAFHMGNTLEPWMQARVDALERHPDDDHAVPTLHAPRINQLVNMFGHYGLGRLLQYDPIWRWFLRFKGLTRAEAMRF